MAENSEISYQKIKDLIKDTEGDFFNFDSLRFVRTRNEEIIEPIEGELTGEIPKWISGSLIQNGPGAFKIGDVTLNHVFDGMALLHRFNIENGKITYQCRFIKSDSREAIKTQNRMISGEFGTTVTSNGNLLQKLRTLLFQKDTIGDNTLVTIYPIDHDMYAFTETPAIRRFDPKTLETYEKVDLSKSTNIMFQPAHAHVEGGKLYNCGVNMGPQGCFYHIFCVPEGDDKFENVKIIAKIPSTRKFHPSYMHSFGITENYFILIEHPFTMPALALKVSTFIRSSFCNTMKWLENENTYIRLVDRVTGEVKYTFETEPFFVFHTINQYEKDGHVVLDLICYKDAELVRGLLINHLTKMKNEKTKMWSTRPLRFVMPLDVAKEEVSESKNLVTLQGTEAKAFLKSDGTVFCAPEVLLDHSMEFGTVWYKNYKGKSYKYFYAVGFEVHSEYPGKLIKVDVENKTSIEWQEENAYPSEPVFIPSPNAQSEDDGVVVSAVLYNDPDANRVNFVVLDGKTFKELGRCDFKNLSEPVPKTFHGWFVADRK